MTDKATCSRCPGFLYSVESVALKLCHGCRTAGPEMKIFDPPPAAPKPDAANLVALIKTGPLPRSLWRDSGGNVVAVVAVALTESSHDVQVVYADFRGVHWVRPLAEFADGRFKPVAG